MRLHTSDNDNPIEKKVKKFVARDNFKGALDVLQKEQNHAPEDWYLAYLKGWIFQQNNDAVKALESFRKAEEIAPDNVYVKAALGELLLTTNEEEQALNYLKVCVQAWPSSSEAYSFYGEALMRLNLYDEAEYVLKKSIQLNKHNPDAYNALAMLFTKTSRTHLVKPLLEKYVEKSPKIASSHEFLGNHYYYTAGECERAFVFYEEAIKLYVNSPNQSWYKQYLSTLYYPKSIIDSYLDALIYCGYYDHAEDVARNFYTKTEFFSWKVYTLQEKGDIKGAEKYLEKVDKVDSEDTSIKIVLARQDLLDGKVGAAEKKIKSVIRGLGKKGLQEPWHFGVLAVSLFEQGHLDEMYDILNCFKGDDLERLLSSMITLQAEMSNWNQVLLLSRQYLDIEPNSPQAFHFIAKAHLMLGHPQKSIDAYQSMLDLQPNNGNALQEIGVAYKKAGQLEHARRALKHAIASDKVPRPKKKIARMELDEL